MLAEIIREYLELFPIEKERLSSLFQQLNNGDDLQDRENYTGHVTGAGVVLSPDRSRVLLIHHRLLDKWLQPGGHWEPEDATPLDIACREVAEETGVRQLTHIPLDAARPLLPFDIDSHFIAKPRAPQLPHWHHDFRYLFVAKDVALSHEAEEVFAAEWFAFDAPETKAIRPLLEKLRATGLLAS